MYDSIDQAFDQVDAIAVLGEHLSAGGADPGALPGRAEPLEPGGRRALVLGGMTADDAIALIREKRSPACLCNPSFERWLRQPPEPSAFR